MKELIFASAFALVSIFSSSVEAQEAYPGKVREAVYSSLAKPLMPYMQCITFAATSYNVNEFILLSVLLVEAGYTAPLRMNDNGTIDHGFGQINTVRESEIAKIGLTLSDVATNPCKNILATSYILRKEIEVAADVWTGVANYHYDINGDYPKHHHGYRQRVISRLLSIVSIAQSNK